MVIGKSRCPRSALNAEYSSISAEYSSISAEYHGTHFGHRLEAVATSLPSFEVLDKQTQTGRVCRSLEYGLTAIAMWSEIASLFVDSTFKRAPLGSYGIQG